eukprot:3439049-Amphidinium_carterae.3
MSTTSNGRRFQAHAKAHRSRNLALPHKCKDGHQSASEPVMDIHASYNMCQAAGEQLSMFQCCLSNARQHDQLSRQRLLPSLTANSAQYS